MASSHRRECKNKPDSFCYVCGCYTLLSQRPNITSFVKHTYKAYFQISLVTKTRNGHLIFCVITVRKCFAIGQKGNKRDCLLEFPWFGENLEIMRLTAISAWSTRKVLARKIGIRSSIQAFLQPFDLFHIVKNFCSQFLVVFSHVQTVIMISESIRAAIARWFLNLNRFQMAPIRYQPLSCLAKRN